MMMLSDDELLAQIRRHEAACTASRGFPSRPLRELSPILRAESERIRRDNREATEAVVAELRRRGKPVVLDGVEYRLTPSFDQFIALDVKTGEPILGDQLRDKGVIFDYRTPITIATGRRNCQEVMP